MPRKYKEIEELYIYLPDEREKKLWADTVLLVYAFIKRAARPYLRFSLKSISSRLHADPRVIKQALKVLQEFNYIKLLSDDPQRLVIAVNLNNKCKTFVRLNKEALNLIFKDKYPLSRVVIIELIKWLTKHKKKIKAQNYSEDTSSVDIVYAMNSFFAKYTAYSRITVWRTLRDLEKAGIVTYATRTKITHGRFKSARIIRIHNPEIQNYPNLIKEAVIKNLNNKETNNIELQSNSETRIISDEIGVQSNKVDNTDSLNEKDDKNCFKNDFDFSTEGLNSTFKAAFQLENKKNLNQEEWMDCNLGENEPEKKLESGENRDLETGDKILDEDRLVNERNEETLKNLGRADGERYCGHTIKQIYEGVARVVGGVGQKFRLRASYYSVSDFEKFGKLSFDLGGLKFEVFGDFEIYKVVRGALKRVRSPRRGGCKHLDVYVYVHKKTRRVAALYIIHQAVWYGYQIQRYLKPSAYIESATYGTKRWFIFDSSYLLYAPQDKLDKMFFSKFLKRFREQLAEQELGVNVNKIVETVSFIPFVTLRNGKYFDYSPSLKFNGVVTAITFALREARDRLWYEKGINKPVADFLIRAGVFRHIFDMRIIARHRRGVAVSEFLLGRIFAVGAIYNLIDAFLEDYSLLSGAKSIAQLAHIIDEWEDNLTEYNKIRFDLPQINETFVRELKNGVFRSGRFRDVLLGTDFKQIGQAIGWFLPSFKATTELRQRLAAIVMASFKGYATLYLNEIMKVMGYVLKTDSEINPWALYQALYSLKIMLLKEFKLLLGKLVYFYKYDALKLYDELSNYERSNLEYQVLSLFNMIGSKMYYYGLMTLNRWAWGYIDERHKISDIISLVSERLLNFIQLRDIITKFGSVQKLITFLNDAVAE